MKRSELLTQMEAWYRQEAEALYNYLVYRAGDQALADEIMAAACERALKKLHQFDPQKGNFSAWMFAIVRNTLSDAFRRNGRYPAEISLEALPPVEGRGATLEERAVRADQFQQVIRHLGKLNDNEREAVALRYGGELPYREIALVMGVSTEQIGVLLNRALAKLRAAVYQSETEEEYEDQRRSRS